MEYAFSVYDVVRVDHFRAFDEYYAISAKESDARSGVWEPGPGMDFFRALRKHFPKLPIIAEDLGLLTDSVIRLVRDTGFPSMKMCIRDRCRGGIGPFSRQSSHSLTIASSSSEAGLFMI